MGKCMLALRRQPSMRKLQNTARIWLSAEQQLYNLPDLVSCAALRFACCWKALSSCCLMSCPSHTPYVLVIAVTLLRHLCLLPTCRLVVCWGTYSAWDEAAARQRLPTNLVSLSGPEV